MQRSKRRWTAWVVALMGAAVFLGSGTWVAAGNQTQAHAAPVRATAPYGGCDEAWQAPRSPGADLCRARGWSVSARFLVGPRAVVRHSSLPHCRFEDGSGGPRPCTWNVGPRVDGNGIGLAYKVRRDMSARYVWPRSPAVDGWRWVTVGEAHRLAVRATWLSGRRSVTAWQRCVVRPGHTGRVRCPDGVRPGW
jgi:hypothetical protein